MKISKILLNFCAAVYIILIISTSSYAIPTLQLYSPDGRYEHRGDIYDSPFDEGILISDPSFTLQALLSLSKKNGPDVKQDFYLSCALLNSDGTKVNSLSKPFSVSVNNVNYNSTSFSFGRPIGMQPHGVFNTYYTQILFNFDETDFTSNGIFDIQDPMDDSKAGYIHNFDINLNGLDEKYGMVFDLYTYSGKKGNAFAPFSHNVAFLSEQGSIVPLPSPLFLLCLGLAGVVGFKRKLSGDC